MMWWRAGLGWGGAARALGLAAALSLCGCSVAAGAAATAVVVGLGVATATCYDRVQVTVADETGSAICDARVVFKRGSSEQEATGCYHAPLSEGEYELVVTRPGSLAFKEPVSVKREGSCMGNTQTIWVALGAPNTGTRIRPAAPASGPDPRDYVPGASETPASGTPPVAAPAPSGPPVPPPAAPNPAPQSPNPAGAPSAAPPSASSAAPSRSFAPVP